MGEWHWTTWLLAVLAFAPAMSVAAGLAFSSTVVGTELLVVGFLLGFAAIGAFGIHLARAYWTGERGRVGRLVGYGLAFGAGPLLSLIPFGETLPSVIGWAVTMLAFPIYWYREVKPEVRMSVER